MTQLEMVANIAEVAGGMAIIISLVYVGYQVRQSNRFAKVENMRVLLNMSFMDQYDLGVVARGWHDFDSLELDDKQHFHRYMMRLVNQYRMVYDTWRLGLVEEQLVNDWKLGLTQIMVTKGGEQWWREGGNLVTSGESLQKLEEYFSKYGKSTTPYNKLIKWMDFG